MTNLTQSIGQRSELSNVDRDNSFAITNFIGGEFYPPAGGQWLTNHNPATGDELGPVADSDRSDIDAAVAAARQAFSSWSRLPAAQRSAHLVRLADLIARDAELLARAETTDTGKPLSLSRAVDILRAETNFRFFAGLVNAWASESHPMPDAINYTLRQPLGVVGCISPWNLPLYLLTWKIAPALAVGNCVVAKPSEVTPLTAWHLGRLCIEAQLPPGVLNIVHGSGNKAGAALVAHSQVRAVSFTGSTQTGSAIAAAAAPRFKKLSLELGGKNPNVVFADCDYAAMLETTVRSSFSNSGQICLCGSRILVQRELYARFRDDLVASAQRLKVGDPLEPDTVMGSVVSQQHFEKVMSCLQTARDEGGRILTGGQRAEIAGRCSGGWFIEPTVIEGLPGDCRTNQEEIFGPVVTLLPFDDEQQAIELANDVPYGLSASVWTSDLGRGHRVAESLEAGVVWVNCWLVRDLRTPFGGVKHSGVGREGGFEAFRFFTDTKNICVKYR